MGKISQNMIPKFSIDKKKKYIEINDRLIQCGEFFRIIDLVPGHDIDGWTIKFNFDKK